MQEEQEGSRQSIYSERSRQISVYSSTLVTAVDDDDGMSPHWNQKKSLLTSEL